MQLEEEELNRKRAANKTALEAIGGPRKKRKLDEALESLQNSQSSGNSSLNQANTPTSTADSAPQVSFLGKNVIIANNIHKRSSQEYFEACARYFLRNFYFSPNDSPSKTMKDVISSKNLFFFSRYSDFCISTFPSFSPSQPLLESLIQDES